MSLVTLSYPSKFKLIEETNLIEQEGKTVAQNGDSLEFIIKPFEIKTFRIVE